MVTEILSRNCRNQPIYDGTKNGYGEEEFFLFQRKRIVKSSFMMLAAIPLALTISKWLFLLAPVLFIYNWWSDYQKEKESSITLSF